MDRSSLHPEVMVRGAGRVLARYDHRTQDSGNVSWIVRTPEADLFVKTAGEDVPPPDGAPIPYLDHAERVALLRTALEISRTVDHPVLARLRNVAETPSGPMLIYERAPGRLVGVPSADREDPGSSYRRFAEADPRTRLAVFDQLLDAHRAMEAAGWVACDLYDGCLMVDLATSRLTLIDLDTYQRGAFTNGMGTMFGSARFMAPEEFEFGAIIDARTTVFTLGRLISHFGTGLTEDLEEFCGGGQAGRVIARATRPDCEDRFASVEEFEAAWTTARSSTRP